MIHFNIYGDLNTYGLESSMCNEVDLLTNYMGSQYAQLTAATFY